MKGTGGEARRLLISFSGGETSALMAKLCVERLAPEYDEIRTVFANTGQENEETLAFVDQCDKAFGLNVTWVEAAPSRGRDGIGFRVVDFATASRAGEPFEAAIQLYGIPNKAFPQCSRELKTRPIRKWATSIGWDTRSYDNAVGIRADEIDRMVATAKRDRVIYPLISRFPHTKPMVNEFWARQPFRLPLKGYQGNCTWCWKKSLRKHLTIITENPSAYDFPERMEALYPNAGAGRGGRVFFREGRSTKDLRELAATTKFAPATDDAREYQTDLIEWLDADLDVCGSESCEVDFAVDDVAGRLAALEPEESP